MDGLLIQLWIGTWSFMQEIKSSNIMELDGSVNLYAWLGQRNFGDELSPYLVEKLTGRPVRLKSELEPYKIAAIGSLISLEALTSHTVFWGTGILTENLYASLHRFKCFPIRKAYRQLKLKASHDKKLFYALRGPYTADVLLKLGFSPNKMTNVFADPAVLVPYVYTPTHSAQRYELGIILHMNHNSEGLNKLVAERFSDKVRVIDIHREGNQQLEQCLDEICACDKIASTSLHGIILAQAYGIPAVFLQNLVEPLANHSVFKFNDYFLGTHQKPQTPVQFSDYLTLVNQLLRMNFPQPPKFRQFCQNLLDVFPCHETLKISSLPYA